jgi:predicted aspartyl protease
MGEVRVEVELVNYGQQYMADKGLLDPDKVTRVTVTGVVDTGATNSVLPRRVADRLGVLHDTTEEVIVAGGAVVTVPITQIVEFRAMGRHAMEECIVMGDEVLLGQFFLEQTDFFVDSKNKRLVGNPEHPTHRVLKVRRAARRRTELVCPE